MIDAGRSDKNCGSGGCNAKWYGSFIYKVSLQGVETVIFEGVSNNCIPKRTVSVKTLKQ